MKKVRKEFRADDLMVDILEYAFTEWLVRRRVFAAFKANFDTSYSPGRSFRDHLRHYVRRSLISSRYGPRNLVSAAFMFLFTPEGNDFWLKESNAWERFYSEFQTKR